MDHEDGDGLGAFRALVWWTPVGVAFWAVILWAIFG